MKRSTLLLGLAAVLVPLLMAHTAAGVQGPTPIPAVVPNGPSFYFHPGVATFGVTKLWAPLQRIERPAVDCKLTSSEKLKLRCVTVHVVDADRNVGLAGVHLVSADMDDFAFRNMRHWWTNAQGWVTYKAPRGSEQFFGIGYPTGYYEQAAREGHIKLLRVDFNALGIWELRKAR